MNEDHHVRYTSGELVTACFFFFSLSLISRSVFSPIEETFSLTFQIEIHGSLLLPEFFFRYILQKKKSWISVTCICPLDAYKLCELKQKKLHFLNEPCLSVTNLIKSVINSLRLVRNTIWYIPCTNPKGRMLTDVFKLIDRP